MENERPSHLYVGRCPTDGRVLSVTGDVGDDLAEYVGGMIRDGLKAERVTWAQYELIREEPTFLRYEQGVEK